MPTLLLVDDEELARYALKTLISRNFSDVSVVAEAQTGMQAVELYRKMRPDGVIMDIKIPGMNGIETSRQILKEFPNANIVICSAYDSYSFVSQALDIGAKGYMLKPVNKEEAIEKISRMFGVKHAPIQALAEKQALHLMLTGQLSQDVCNQLERYYGNIMQGGLILFGLSQENQKGDIESFLPALSTAVKKQSVHTGFAFVDKIASYACAFVSQVEEDELAQIAQRAACVLGEAGFYRYQLVQQGNWAQMWQTLNSPQQGDAQSVLQESERLMRKLRQGEPSGVAGALDAWIVGAFAGDYDSALSQSVKLLVLMNQQLELLGIGFESQTMRLLDSREKQNKDALEMTLRSQAASMAVAVQRLHGKKESALKSLYDYINDSTLSTISLENLAQSLGISAQYLSRAFKEETGANFIEFITNKRMELAHRLLCGQGLALKEVAAKCGYSDTNYFSRVFKKTYGVLPSEITATPAANRCTQKGQKKE